MTTNLKNPATSIRFDNSVKEFRQKHRDTVGRFFAIMLAVFRTCQTSVKTPVDLEKAHDHVFGSEDQHIKPCEWCAVTFKKRKEHQERFLTQD